MSDTSPKNIPQLMPCGCKNNVYEKCPILEDETYLLRLVEESDQKDLLKVYSDKNALPFFNSDNCNGDNFYYPTEEQMQNAIRFWLTSYKDRWFVRYTIVSKITNTAIGTIELFRRDSDDAFNGVGVLRLDVGSENERTKILSGILSLVLDPTYELFDCDAIITKVPIYAVERIAAVKALGFEKSDDLLVGQHDRYAYKDYWIKPR